MYNELTVVFKRLYVGLTSTVFVSFVLLDTLSLP